MGLICRRRLVLLLLLPPPLPPLMLLLLSSAVHCCRFCYRGFRKYERIRETLIHELAHMVYGDHDDNFKRLNSQLLAECAAHLARTTGGGRRVAGGSARGGGGAREEGRGRRGCLELRIQ